MNARATAAWLEGLYDRIVSSSPAHVREDAYAAALGYPRCGQQLTIPTPASGRTYTCVLNHDYCAALEHAAADGTTWHPAWAPDPHHSGLQVHLADGTTLTLTLTATDQEAA